MVNQPISPSQNLGCEIILLTSSLQNQTDFFKNLLIAFCCRIIIDTTENHIFKLLRQDCQAGQMFYFCVKILHPQPHNIVSTR